MHDAVFHALFSSERKSQWVFCDSKGEKLEIQALGKRFKRQFVKLGIRDANLHAWRHTFASYLTMRTGNIRAVQKLLGHKSHILGTIWAQARGRNLRGRQRERIPYPWVTFEINSSGIVL